MEEDKASLRTITFCVFFIKHMVFCNKLVTLLTINLLDKKIAI